MIVSCGTAYLAGMYGKLLLENLTGIAVETHLASEFRDRDPKIDPGTLIIPVSQSEKTADTLASARMAKDRGSEILSIYNVEGSSLVREAMPVCLPIAARKPAWLRPGIYCATDGMCSDGSVSRFGARRFCGRWLDGYLKDLREVPDALHYAIQKKPNLR